MQRAIARIGTTFALMAVAVGGLAPTAGAVDPLVSGGGVVNGAILPSDCTITASTPSLVGSNVQATGQLQCGFQRDALVAQVCIQYKQPFVQEQVTWLELTCGIPSRRENASSLGASASAPCVPGEWAYRAYATAEVHKNDHVTRNGAGLDVSESVVITCKLA